MPTDDALLRLVPSMSADEQRALVDSLLQRSADSFLAELRRPKVPTLRRKPRKVRGFQVRVDLLHVKPPIWRRLVLPGDLTLERVHLVLNEAMGWTNSHLHRIRTGSDPYSPCFITEFDRDEGDEGILEDDVRLDQVFAEAGDALWYDYDFGDGWEHVVKVEAVLLDPPAGVEIVTGRRACPPEDVGGIWGYDTVAQWVESRYDDALLPEQFENARHGRDWLPRGWDPATFDLESTRIAIRDVLDVADED